MAEDIYAQRNKFFKGQRDEVSRGANAFQQQADDTVKRRFAAIGQSGSGANIAAQLKAQEMGAAQRDAAMNQIGGLELQAGEADIGRQFAAQQADKDMGFKRSLFDIEQGNKLKELNLAERQFALDSDTTGFNRRMAEIESNRKPPGMLDNIIPGLNPTEIFANPMGIGGAVQKIVPKVPGITGGK